MLTGRPTRPTIRWLGRAALLPFAAVVVHQLRYALAFGASSSAELARQGHSYLHSLAPWLALLLALAAGGFLWSVGRALAGQRTLRRYTVSLAGLWFVCSLCLLAIYVGQEALEGLFATGHPAGLAGIFGYGGWWAIPVSACVGLVLAAILHGARWVLDEIAGRRRPVQTPGAAAPAARHAWIDPALPRLSPLAGGWSGRGPPV
jgi:preprotein translocase subunit SecG